MASFLTASSDAIESEVESLTMEASSMFDFLAVFGEANRSVVRCSNISLLRMNYFCVSESARIASAG